MSNIRPAQSGHGDLVDSEARENGRRELYRLLDEALEEEKRGAYTDFDDFMLELKQSF